MRRSVALALVSACTVGCTATATQTFGTGMPGRAPRSTELAADLRPGRWFGGAEMIVEAGVDEVAVRGAHLRGGGTIAPTPGSDEIWSADLGLTGGLGRPPFRDDETTTLAAGAFGDLALRIAGHGAEPGRVELSRWSLSLVLGARARVWPWAEPTGRFSGNGEVAGGLGLRLGFDTDARSIVDKALEETANAFGL